MIHGKDLIVTSNVGGSQVAIAACKTCKLSVGGNFLDACSPTSGWTKKKVPTGYGWSISCDCLIGNPTYALQLLEALKGGTELTLQFIAVGFKQTGKAFVKNWDANGSVGSLASLSVQFEGSEDLTTNSGWEFSNGTLNTYGTFSNGTLTMGGVLQNGTLIFQ